MDNLLLAGKKDNKEWMPSLYNAVNHSSYAAPDSIEFTTMEDVVYMGMRNDVSFSLCKIMNAQFFFYP